MKNIINIILKYYKTKCYNDFGITETISSRGMVKNLKVRYGIEVYKVKVRRGKEDIGMRKKWKRMIGITMSGLLFLQTGLVSIQAESASVVSVKTVETGSDVWETPVIPDAAAEIPGISKTEIDLNETTGDGTWKFLYDIPDFMDSDSVPAPTEKKQDFDFTSWNNRDWQEIIVPGEAVMQGFDILTNNEYYYQREITVPEDFAGNRVLVRFDGVYSNARIWINENYIRTHVGGFTTWDCDITEYAAPGETVTLTVGVADLYSDEKGIWNPEGKMLNNPSNATEYAHHNIGGILRDVSLVAMPYDYIAHSYVNTDFDEDFIDADLEVTVQLGMVSEQAQILVELLDGKQVVSTGDISFQQREEAAKQLIMHIEAPKKWDAEHPNLYTLRMTLSAEGKKVQVNEEKIGFREIQYGGKDGTDGNKVYVNGHEVKLRGTCRHDVSDNLGRSMTREEAYAEATAYKNANINFIRTSHYPASEDLLDACDELGIYVEQETAVCFQGYGTFGSNVYSKYEDYLPQFTEMIERDRNRASILIWSLGNESNYSNVANQSGGNAFQTEKEYLLDVDTTRPCIFSWPNTGEPWDLADIYSQHYANIQGGMGSSGKPVLHDEYAHIACYNIDELQRDVNVRNFWGESVKKAWENIFTSDGALGGALWGGIDDVFYIPEGTQERWQSHSDGQTAGYGEWGSVLDAYLREKPEAYLTKKAYSPVRVDESACYITDGVLHIPVKNWFDHTNMNEVEMEYTADGKTSRIQIAESILPHKEGVISVPGIAGNARTVNLKFYTADGIMVDEYNVELAPINYKFTSASEEGPKYQETEEEIVVSGSDFKIIFSKTSGLISQGSFGKPEDILLTGGPYLQLTGVKLGEWISAGIEAESVDNYVVVTMRGSYANGQGVEFKTKISGNGILTTEYTLTTRPAKEWGLQEVGISYDIPSDMESVSWLREGLYSAYPEDHIGRNKGVALKEREGAEVTPDQYGVEPFWPWKDDMKNYFVYATDAPNNGLVTNDFKTMREHIYYYHVNYGTEENSPRISVESEDGTVAARVDVSYALAYVDDRDSVIRYSGGWKTYASDMDYAGTETYSTAVGDSCEFTFEGTGVRYIGSKQKNTGKVKIFVDGEFREEVDTYSDLGNELKQSVIYSINDLEKGEHTIRLETSGGNADCIVVDAFEVLGEESGAAAERARLIINNQWYYPNLAWGNYTGVAGNVYYGYTNVSTIRLTDVDSFYEEAVPSLSDVTVTKTEEGSLKVRYDLRNAAEGTEVKFCWYRIAEGDPDSKAQMIENDGKAELDVRDLTGNRIYCEVSLENAGTVIKSVKSNLFEVGLEDCEYFDVLAGSESFVFIGTEGIDYQTDRNQSWTQGAYNKSVTYLLDTSVPTVEKAEVSFDFVGKGIRWIGAKEENQGIAEVLIDGELQENVDLFGKNVTTGNQIREVLFEKIWNESGEHTITIRRTGEKDPEAIGANVNLDAFLVIKQTGDIQNPEQFASLNALIQIAELFIEEEDKYTPSGIDALKKAMEAAKTVVGNNQATGQEIREAYQNLAVSMTSVIRRADKSELENVLNKAERILSESEKYLKSSIADLQTVTDEAKEVNEDPEIDVDRVREVLKKLIHEILKARLMGDVDQNGIVDTEDVAKLLRVQAELEELSEEQFQVADVNRDGDADSSDAVSILRYAAEMPDSL